MIQVVMKDGQTQNFPRPKGEIKAYETYRLDGGVLAYYTPLIKRWYEANI